MSPLISVIVPTYNRSQSLKDLLFRLDDQIFINWELIIVDDSIDNVSSDFFKNFRFNVNYIHRGKKFGVSSARNLGALHAKGKYLVFLDDDDDFTDSWLHDFAFSARSEKDLIFCNMKRIESDSSTVVISVKHRGSGGIGNGIVIPGAWMIKKSIFSFLGGYDEELLFAENTELFIRLNNKDLTKEFVNKTNFIYNPSIDGGSKNLRNMTSSINIILLKHGSILNSHIIRLYNQILGVNYIRFRDFSKARYHLWIAYKLNLTRFDTLGRLLISLFPFFAKLVYTEEVKS